MWFQWFLFISLIFTLQKLGTFFSFWRAYSSNRLKLPTITPCEELNIWIGLSDMATSQKRMVPNITGVLLQCHNFIQFQVWSEWQSPKLINIQVAPYYKRDFFHTLSRLLATYSTFLPNQLMFGSTFLLGSTNIRFLPSKTFWLMSFSWLPPQTNMTIAGTSTMNEDVSPTPPSLT